MSKVLVSREYHDISVNSELEFLEWYYLIDLDSIKKKAILTDDTYLEIENVGDLTVDELNDCLEKIIEEDGSNKNIDCDVIEGLNERFELDLSYRMCKDTEEFPDSNTILYSYNEGEFLYADYLEYYDIYTFWDGSNWQNWEVQIDDENIESNYVKVCLDQWDGRNMVTGGMGYHAYVKKLDNDKYLIIESSQWQGSQDIATIADKNELVEYLKIYDRDVNEYLERFENIE